MIPTLPQNLVAELKCSLELSVHSSLSLDCFPSHLFLCWLGMGLSLPCIGCLAHFPPGSLLNRPFWFSWYQYVLLALPEGGLNSIPCCLPRSFATPSLSWYHHGLLSLSPQKNCFQGGWGHLWHSASSTSTLRRANFPVQGSSFSIPTFPVTWIMLSYTLVRACKRHENPFGFPVQVSGNQNLQYDLDQIELDALILGFILKLRAWTDLGKICPQPKYITAFSVESKDLLSLI